MNCLHKNCLITMEQKVMSDLHIENCIPVGSMTDGEPKFIRYVVWCYDCSMEFIYYRHLPQWLQNYLDKDKQNKLDF